LIRKQIPELAALIGAQLLFALFHRPDTRNP
jgi:hypothetical protein